MSKPLQPFGFLLNSYSSSSLRNSSAALFTLSFLLVCQCINLVPQGLVNNGQAPPAIIHPQAEFGYQQQLVPGMRPGGGQCQIFIPMVQQGQPGQRRGSGPVQQPQQPVPFMQQQMVPRGRRSYRYLPGRNMSDVQVPSVAGGMLSVPYDMGGMPMRDAPVGQPLPITALASALANAAPEQQRTMLGENLYPLVDQLEHEAAAKVAGMLLEMDQYWLRRP